VATPRQVLGHLSAVGLGATEDVIAVSGDDEREAQGLSGRLHASTRPSSDTCLYVLSTSARKT